MTSLFLCFGKKQDNRDFPGSPVVKTSAFNAEGSIPGLGTKSLHAMQPRNNNNKKVFMDRMSYPEL